MEDGDGRGARAHRAEAALLATTLAWGLTFPMIKGALADAPPFAFLALRFPLALPLLWLLMRFRRPSRQAVVPGLVLGLALTVSFYAQTLGLTSTTPTRSAFITGLSVILVPLLYPVFTRRLPGRWPAAGAAVAAAGLYLLTDPGGGGVNRGDWITLVCAAGYALYIILLEIYSRRLPYRDLLLIQLLLASVIFIPPALIQGGTVHVGPGLLWGLLTTGPILALTLYLQNRFQKDTTATRAAVIFSGEPVFASIFSYLIYGETLGPVQWGGAALILIGILVAERR
jgi:drug/metabolite transporter (DMT)-like permease